MKFEWDSKKASSNKKKHGISFGDAITAFDDPYALIAPDRKHSTEEEIREWLIGETDNGVLVVIFTRRLARISHKGSLRGGLKRASIGRAYRPASRVPRSEGDIPAAGCRTERVPEHAQSEALMARFRLPQ